MNPVPMIAIEAMMIARSTVSHSGIRCRGIAWSSDPHFVPEEGGQM